jgi:hypothetical protein
LSCQSLLSCPDCLSWLSIPGCPVLALPSWQSCPGCPFGCSFRSWLFVPAVVLTQVNFYWKRFNYNDFTPLAAFFTGCLFRTAGTVSEKISLAVHPYRISAD